MLDRYLAEDEAFFAELEGRARELSDDPLHSFLVFLRLYAEAMAEVAARHPGCIVATITYQDQSFDRVVREMLLGEVQLWRTRFRAWLGEIEARYSPRIPVDTDTLADTVLALTYGGMTLVKALDKPDAIARQVLQLRQTIQLFYAPAPAQ